MSLNFKKYILLLFFVAAFLNFAKATPTANKSLHRVYEKLMKLKDYSAEVNIQSNIPLIKILPL